MHPTLGAPALRITLEDNITHIKDPMDLRYPKVKRRAITGLQRNKTPVVQEVTLGRLTPATAGPKRTEHTTIRLPGMKTHGDSAYVSLTLVGHLICTTIVSHLRNSNNILNTVPKTVSQSQRCALKRLATPTIQKIPGCAPRIRSPSTMFKTTNL